jgi:hypothetical protein
MEGTISSVPSCIEVAKYVRLGAGLLADVGGVLRECGNIFEFGVISRVIFGKARRGCVDSYEWSIICDSCNRAAFFVKFFVADTVTYLSKWHAGKDGHAKVTRSFATIWCWARAPIPDAVGVAKTS